MAFEDISNIVGRLYIN